MHELGCHVVLTNSNHPLVHELYSQFTIDIIPTRRCISCNGKRRSGEDAVVTVLPKQKTLLHLAETPLPQQVGLYPPTRYMGSKSKLLSSIWSIASQFSFDTAVDLFSGSGVVGYMFKAEGTYRHQQRLYAYVLHLCKSNGREQLCYAFYGYGKEIADSTREK